MQIFRCIWYWVHCRSVRDLYFIVIFCTVLMCYISFHFNTPFKQVNTQGSWKIKALQRSILAQHGQSDGRWVPVAKSVPADDFKNQLFELLLQVEDNWRKAEMNQKRIAEVRGQRDVISRDLKLYENVLKKNGFKVVFQDSVNENISENISTSHVGRKNWPKESNVFSNEWLLLLCLTFSDTPCLPSEQISKLKAYQKVNIFPGLRGIVSKRGAFCQTMTMAKQLPELRNEYISPLCFTLPGQFNQLVHVAHALGYAVKWTVKSLSNSQSSRNSMDPGPRVIDLFDGGGREQLKKLFNQKVIVQQLQNSPFTIFSQPISLRVYILVTSVAPLRAYVHNEGLVFHRQGPDGNFRKIAGRTWLLSELWQYILKYRGGSGSVKSAITNLYHVLLQMLLIVEAAILSSLAKNDDEICRNCFQLLGVDCVFNSSLYPVILEVNGQPTLMKGIKATKINKMKKSILDDVISLLFSPFTSVAHDVAEALHGVSSDIGILDWSCPISSELCLSRPDLQYFLKSRQESINQGGFRQLYPSADAGRYGIIAEQLQRQFTEHQTAMLWLNYRQHSTSDLHRLLVSLERWYAGASSEEYFNDIDVGVGNGPTLPRKSVNLSEILQIKKYTNYMSANDVWLNDVDNDIEITCNNDPATMPFLSSIRAFPALSLQPPFDPKVTEYYVNVTFEVMLLRVWATVLNCQTEARLDDRFGSSRPTNTTLGVGENKINIMVVDISSSEPWIINTYTLSIYRLPVTHNEGAFHHKKEHEVCSLKQECEMKLFFKEPCGVQKDVYHHLTWPRYMAEKEKKPLCQTGDAAGRWVLPCQTCSNRNSCYWKEAVWHPYSCKYQAVKPDALSQCLRNKKLLFIGDSTNRGMMHYLIERLNGTLTEWDKTHDIRMYSNINNQSTMVSFAYYPQFWLPTNQRPVFDKALYQLIQRSRPLENNSNTIMVVGGVHWLATQHLHMLLRAIRVERLHGMKLVMKTLGAGFHQPVDNVHSLSIEEQHKLILHNKGLSEFAHHYDFEVIDTFNITAARYKDFMQGKCACHFHRVVADTKYDPHRLLRTESKFHVEGPVNAIYSEILISRLCNDFENERK